MEILRPVGQAAQTVSTLRRLCKRDLCRPAKVFFVDVPVSARGFDSTLNDMEPTQ